MDSATVRGVGDCAAFNAMGSPGLFRANGPIAAHPPFRMRRIPPGVVLAKARIPRKHAAGGYYSLGWRPENRLGYSLSIRTIRPWAAGSAASGASSWAFTDFWNTPSWSFGSTTKNDFKTTMASRRQVFKSKGGSSTARQSEDGAA